MSDANHETASILFSKPIERVTWLTLAGILVAAWVTPVTPMERALATFLVFVASVATFVRFRWLAMRYPSSRRVLFLAIALNILFISYGTYLFSRYDIHTDLFFVLVVVNAGVIGGWQMAWRFAALAAAGDVIAEALIRGMTPMLLIVEAIHFVVFLAAGYSSSALAAIIRRQSDQAARRQRDLEFLLDASRTIVSTIDLNATLPRLAEQIALALPATFCRIGLLDKDQQHLIPVGVFPLRDLEGWTAGLGDRYALEDLPWHRRTIESGELTIVRKNDPAEATGDIERAALFFKSLQTACLAPIAVSGQRLGLISIGEAREWEREPFDARKLELVRTLAAQVALSIQNAQSFRTAHAQAERVAVLNEVARTVGSTIEMDQLLEVVRQQVMRVIRTDTYYVSLYDAREDVTEIRVLIDDGQRFPPQRIPLGAGLSSLVLQRRQPLLVRDLQKELPALGVQVLVLGSQRASESWLGVPLLVGGELLGLIAVASYEPNAFDEDDAALLTNIGEQVAVALDNARHHAEVEEQARRDSLTGAYNHGYFLKRLREEVESADALERPVSLIMLDIDFFKEYNNRYGHVVGDNVLRIVVESIQAHVKKTDAIGRWGGEEFGIVLGGANAEQASVVAQRVRETLAQSRLIDSKGMPIPAPTISQGVATFPDHVRDADALVMVADRALYRAKESGRDQVRVADPTASIPASRTN